MHRTMDPELIRANEQKAREMLKKTDFTRNLGLELISLTPGKAVGQIRGQSGIFNTNGVVHGGALYALADTMASLAAASWGAGGPTIQGSISYMHPAQGTLTCTATVTHYGGQIIFSQADITDESGQSVCRAEFTNIQAKGLAHFGLQSVYRDTEESV